MRKLPGIVCKGGENYSLRKGKKSSLSCLIFAVQTNHIMNMVTTVHPLITDASMAIVVDLNTLYSNAIAKYIILFKGNVTMSHG